MFDIAHPQNLDDQEECVKQIIKTIKGEINNLSFIILDIFVCPAETLCTLISNAKKNQDKIERSIRITKSSIKPNLPMLKKREESSMARILNCSKWEVMMK